jgi:hypothetical protein
MRGGQGFAYSDGKIVVIERNVPMNLPISLSQSPARPAGLLSSSAALLIVLTVALGLLAFASQPARIQTGGASASQPAPRPMPVPEPPTPAATELPAPASIPGAASMPAATPLAAQTRPLPQPVATPPASQSLP